MNDDDEQGYYADKARRNEEMWPYLYWLALVGLYVILFGFLLEELGLKDNLLRWLRGLGWIM